MNMHYKVALLDDTLQSDVSFIRTVLDSIPGNLWSFEIVPLSEVPYTIVRHVSLHELILPTTPNTMLFVDPSLYDCNYAGVAACEGKYETCRRVTITMPKGDRDFELMTLRVHHELLHAHGAPADGMLKSPEFDASLPEAMRDEFVNNKTKYEHSRLYQKYYYRYLMRKYFDIVYDLPEDYPTTPVSETKPGWFRMLLNWIVSLFRR